jgi:hypothetical protein
VQPAGVAEGTAGFARVADERGDCIAAREQAADDLAADAAGGADHSGAHRVSLWVKLNQFEDVRRRLVARVRPAGLGASGRLAVAGAVRPEAAASLSGHPPSTERIQKRDGVTAAQKIVSNGAAADLPILQSARGCPGGLASRASRPAESSGICRRRVGVPRRQGRAKIIPVGGATGVGLLAVTSDQQIGCCRVTGGWRRPALAWRAGGPVA